MRIAFFLLLALILIVTDQFSKWYVMEYIARPHIQRTSEMTKIPGAPQPAVTPVFSLSGFADWYQKTPEQLGPAQIVVLPNFNIVSVWNKGISFGMFNKQTDYGPMILVGLSFVISLFFLVWLCKNSDFVQSTGIALVIGGALGNVVDRLRFGAVFDFLDFHAFDTHWPAFNIADSSIVMGVFVLIFHSFFIEQKHGVK